MLFGLLLGAFLGAAIGWPVHPALGIAGVFIGAAIGMLYAGLGCLVCGATFDHLSEAVRSKKYLISAFSLIAWLLVSAVVIAIPYAILFSLLSRN